MRFRRFDTLYAANDWSGFLNASQNNLHIPALDGLRGLAFLLVFSLHCIILPDTGYCFLRSVRSIGHFGVDLFFSLSGFLITSILYNAKASPGYFRNFYARRTLRIVPLAYLYLAAYYLLVVKLHVISFGTEKNAQAARDLHWTWFYATNILIALRGSWITASLNHFWTLAVEEHFYLIWPFLVFWLSRKSLLVSVGIITSLAITLRAILLHAGVSGEVVTSFTFCRIDSFAIGGAASLLLTRHDARDALKRYSPAAAISMTSIALLVFFGSNYLYTTIGFTFLALGFSSLLIWAVLWEESPSMAVFRSSTMRFIGKYSYSLYLFHVPILVFVRRKLPLGKLLSMTHSQLLSDLIYVTLIGGLSILTALLTWNLWEKPFLKLKALFPSPPVTGTMSDAPSLPNHEAGTAAVESISAT